MGLFTCTPLGATAVTNLAEPHHPDRDACGAVNETSTCDADINLGVGPQRRHELHDRRGPQRRGHQGLALLLLVGRAGRRSTPRCGSPASTWLTHDADPGQLQRQQHLQRQLVDGSQQLNMFRATAPSPSGCNNTCEVVGVVQHEWGHGMDQNDGGGFDNPSEAYADISEFLADHTSCIGRGFYMGQTCSGLRRHLPDLHRHPRHGLGHAHAAHPVAHGIAGNLIQSCPGGGGPCGKEVHCEAYLAGETIWDLAARDLPAAGYDAATSWQLTDRLWYQSRPGSGGNMYTCTAGSGGCAATSLFSRMRAVDDDDGNLANGTPARRRHLRGLQPPRHRLRPGRRRHQPEHGFPAGGDGPVPVRHAGPPTRRS